jgi:acyl-CoA dehydrogenase
MPPSSPAPAEALEAGSEGGSAVPSPGPAIAAGALAATEAAAHAADQSLQLHGARGYSSACVPERLLRDIQALRIYEGASLIQKTLLARALTSKAK